MQEEGAASIGKQPRANVRRGSFLLHEQRTIPHVISVMPITGARTHAPLVAPRHHVAAKPATWWYALHEGMVRRHHILLRHRRLFACVLLCTAATVMSVLLSLLTFAYLLARPVQPRGQVLDALLVVNDHPFRFILNVGFLAVSLLLATCLVRPRYRRLVRVAARMCPRCGYSRKGLVRADACPECGLARTRA